MTVRILKELTASPDAPGGRQCMYTFMFFYNIFLLITVKDRSYLFYSFYVVGAIVFFASNNGYALEFIWPEWPTLDLYTRFISVPFLMEISFLISFVSSWGSTSKATVYVPGGRRLKQ